MAKKHSCLYWYVVAAVILALACAAYMYMPMPVFDMSKSIVQSEEGFGTKGFGQSCMFSTQCIGKLKCVLGKCVVGA